MKSLKRGSVLNSNYPINIILLDASVWDVNELREDFPELHQDTWVGTSWHCLVGSPAVLKYSTAALRLARLGEIVLTLQSHGNTCP